MATKRMLIDATHPEETRVVVLSGNRLEELDVEAAHRKQLKGNIYLAKVTRVEPSLQAAFVDYGGNRHGFLAFNEIHPDYYQIPVADREALLAEEEAQGSDDDENGENGDGAEVETLGGDDTEEMEETRRSRSSASQRRYKIQEVIKRRQILLVQVVKEERGNKGAALTTYISLAGRYCVLMPNTARGGGISRKIGSGTDRKRLKKILADLSIPEGMAVIVRTAGAERTKAEVKRDYDYLIRLWDTIRETTLQSTAPSLVHEEGNLIKRSIRDLYGNDIDEIIVEGDEGYRTAKDFMKLLIPSHAKRVQPYKDEGMPLFHRFQVETQLDAMHSPTVQLKSGGYIVINPTEALVSIDVNSGRATRERNIEETALKTNLEAASEIARQLRLRDLAGLIVIDFIDMEVNRNQTQVERRLKDAMKSDRARIQIGRISPFGLLEMSRQRLRPSLHETTFEVCPHCEGTGQRRSVESSALYVLRAIEEEGIRRRSSAISVSLATEVALYILNQKRQALADIEARYNFTVALQADDSLIPPAHKLERIKTQAGGEEQAAAAPAPAPGVETEESRSDDDEGGKRRRRRRRGRRRRGGEDAGETPVEAQDEATEEATESDEGAAEEGAAEEGAEAASGEENGEGRSRRRRRGRRGGRRRSRGSREGREERPETPADVGAEVDGGVPELLAAPDEPAALIGKEEEPALLEAPEEEKKKPRRRRRSRKEAAEAQAGTEAETETPEVIEAGAPLPDVIEAGPPAPEVIEAGPPEEEAEKPKRTRRRAPKKKAEEAEGAEEKTEEKPKRTRRAPKKKAEEAEGAEEKAEEKPKRTRRPPKKKAEEAEAAEEKTEEKPKRTRRPPKKKADGEDKAEKASKKADENGADPEAAKTTVIEVGASDAPKRSGWWSR